MLIGKYMEASLIVSYNVELIDWVHIKVRNNLHVHFVFILKALSNNK